MVYSYVERKGWASPPTVVVNGEAANRPGLRSTSTAKSQSGAGGPPLLNSIGQAPAFPEYLNKHWSR